MSELTKKSFKSILSVPIKVEMQPVEHASDRVLTVDELSDQIEEARKGKAKVDSKYVGFVLDERGHLFDYEFNYPKFLENISHVIKEAKLRKQMTPEQVYKNSHEMIIQ
jgi:hypothetical protein